MEAFTLTNMPGLGLAKWDFFPSFSFSLPPLPFLKPGAKERAHQKKHSSFEAGLSEALDKQNDQAQLKGQCQPV